jgi:atypical dual specificity phosphatase
MNEAHELDHSWVARKADWEKRGVKYFWLPTPDFVYSPTIEDIDKAVQFIRSFEGTNQSVYVHCKAGRSRSALICACYLVNVSIV